MEKIVVIIVAIISASLLIMIDSIYLYPDRFICREYCVSRYGKSFDGRRVYVSVSKSSINSGEKVYCDCLINGGILQRILLSSELNQKY